MPQAPVVATAQAPAANAPRLEDLTTQHTRRTDAAARGAELKQLRAAGLSGRDGLAAADGGDVHVWEQHARAGGRSWGPGGIQRAQSGTVVAARCHQSSN
eukprot:COSAG06_NODE_1905_length_8095_cov_10.218984_1_plen_99_part_10